MASDVHLPSYLSFITTSLAEVASRAASGAEKVLKRRGRAGWGGGRGIEKEKEGVEQEGGRERNEDGKGEERHRRSKGREIIDRWIEEKGRDGRKAIKRGKK